jgi:hypothetical protein
MTHIDYSLRVFKSLIITPLRIINFTLLSTITHRQPMQWLAASPSTSSSSQPASHYAHISALLSNSQLAGWSIDRIQLLMFAATLTNVCAHLLARPAMAGCAHHHCTAILFIMAKIVHEMIKVIIIICSEV